MSMFIPRRRSAERPRLQRMQRRRLKETAEVSVPPEMFVMVSCRRRRSPVTIQESGSHGSPVDPAGATSKVVDLQPLVAVFLRERIAVGGAPHADRLWVRSCPRSGPARDIGGPLIHEDGATVGVVADQRPRPHHPSDVGDPEEPVCGLVVERKEDFFRRLDEPASVCEDDTVRFACCPESVQQHDSWSAGRTGSRLISLDRLRLSTIRHGLSPTRARFSNPSRS